jgi:hypothetical protein
VARFVGLDQGGEPVGLVQGVGRGGAALVGLAQGATFQARIQGADLVSVATLVRLVEGAEFVLLRGSSSEPFPSVNDFLLP